MKVFWFLCYVILCCKFQEGLCQSDNKDAENSLNTFEVSSTTVINEARQETTTTEPFTETTTSSEDEETTDTNVDTPSLGTFPITILPKDTSHSTDFTENTNDSTSETPQSTTLSNKETSTFPLSENDGSSSTEIPKPTTLSSFSITQSESTKTSLSTGKYCLNYYPKYFKTFF